MLKDYFRIKGKNKRFFIDIIDKSLYNNTVARSIGYVSEHVLGKIKRGVRAHPEKRLKNT